MIDIAPELTDRFVDRLSRRSLLIPALAGLLCLAADVCESEVMAQRLVLSGEGNHRTPSFELRSGLVGALRVDAVAQLPPNSWADLQFALLDERGEPLAEAIKQIWTEDGTWQEDGESGTWHEDDLDARWDVRGSRDRAAERVRLELSLAGSGSTSGAISGGVPVTVELRVSTGSVDWRWLLMGFALSALCAAGAFYAGAHGGQPVIVANLDNESEINRRAECGGPGRLVRVDLFCLSDETTPGLVFVKLSVRDPQGTLVYEANEVHPPTFVGEDRDVAHVRRSWYFVLRARHEWDFTVKVDPDAPVDRTKLVVVDGATTRVMVPVVTAPDLQEGG